jgi:hypothetical protein
MKLTHLNILIKGGFNMKVKKSLVSKVVSTGLAFMFISSFGLFSASAAGNYHDTVFQFNYNGDGSDVFTEKRVKLDSTSAYVKNRYSTYGFTTNVYGSNDYTNKIGAYCTYGAPVHVSVGQAKYLPNLVWERKYLNAQIGIMSDSHSASKIEGLWSPDSI